MATPKWSPSHITPSTQPPNHRYEHRAAAQRAFLDFLGVSADDSRRERDGVYWSRRFHSGRLQIIALDTRSHREHYLVPSVGGNTWVPFGALVAAATRFATARLGLGRDHDADVLGEEQWAWLENVLTAPALPLKVERRGVGGDGGGTHDRPDLTVVVSSVQVTTSNPLVESWGHFPRARSRLFELLAKHRPRGLLLISGDVHFGEMAASAPGDAGTLEVTSSGLTHSCTTPLWGRFTCQSIVATLGKHRKQDGGE